MYNRNLWVANWSKLEDYICMSVCIYVSLLLFLAPHLSSVVKANPLYTTESYLADRAFYFADNNNDFVFLGQTHVCPCVHKCVCSHSLFSFFTILLFVVVVVFGLAGEACGWFYIICDDNYVSLGLATEKKLWVC